MGKILFSFRIQSYSDIITNSSSELFVFDKDSIKTVIELLDFYVRGWREEYEEPIKFCDLDPERQVDYIYWVSPPVYGWNFETEEEFQEYLIRTYHRCLCIPKEEVPKIFEDWKVEKPNSTDFEYYVKRKHFSEYGLSLLKDKYSDDICLYSIDENPNYDRQETISTFCDGRRYHLG